MPAFIRILPLLTLPLLLSACLSSSPPSNYYLLSAMAQGQTDGGTPSLGIGPVTIPEYLNRNSMVYSHNGNQLRIDSYERWAEPLTDGIERTISLNLARLLNTQSIQAFPWPKSLQPNYGIKLNVLAMDASEEQATLVAEWSINEPGSGTVSERRISRLQKALPGNAFQPELIAPVYSELLLELSELIAAQVRELESNKRPAS
jgi:uncharacterized protein